MLDLLTAEGFEDGGMSIELDEKQVIMWRNRFRAALAALPRNCDVGTDNEQIRRWKEFCDHYEVDRSPESFARWAQGPYFEEGGGDGK